MNRIDKLDNYKLKIVGPKRYVVPKGDQKVVPKITLSRFFTNDNTKYNNSVFAVPSINSYNIEDYSEPLLLIATKSFWLHFSNLKDDLANIHRHLCDSNNQYDFQAITEDLYKKAQLELNDSELSLDTTFVFAKLF